VATFPPVGDLERDTALARIARRHLSCGDSSWSEAGSDGEEAARDVLGYLRRYRGRFPREVVNDDTWDQLVLSAWVYWDERRREAELIRHALSRGLSLREIGAFVGLHSRQGLRDHLDSLEARLHEYHRLTREHRPPRPTAGGAELLRPDTADADEDTTSGPAGEDGDEHVPRRARNPYYRFKNRPRAQRGADGRYTRSRRAAAAARPARASWIADHREAVVTVLGELLAQADRVRIPATESEVGEPATVGDYLTWISEDLPDDVDDGTFSAVGLALGELRTHPEVTRRAGNHGIHQAIAAADRLRADYGELAAAVTGAG